ncbi:glycosyltransferase family 4 protein [Clostridium perfringens]|nr:glycosyltransferase family 4 protein [Clostridium perfringens]
MKKILYITTVSRTINAFLVPHIEMFIKEGYKVDCACSIDKAIDNSLIENGVNVYEIPFSRNPLHPANMKALKKLVKIQSENEYDIIHVHTPVASVYGRLLKFKFPNLKTIYTVHGFHFHKEAPLLNWVIYYPIEKFMSKFTDIMITINSEDYEIAKKLNIKEVYKIDGVGVDLKEYNLDNFDRKEIRKNLGLKENDFVILMIAEVNKNKNHKQMIDAIKLLKNKGIENIKVICAGDGVMIEEVCNYIEENKLQDNIKMLGFRTDINELIISCDIGILMSYREGLPRNIMEFMACAKPVIGTNVRGIRDLIQNEINGYLVELNDKFNTANSIEKLYYYSNLKNDMGQASKKLISSYSIDNVLNELKDIMKNL